MSILRHRLFSASAASVLALAVAAPAVAQEMSAKDAWTRLREAASGAGLSITSQSVTDFGTSIAVNGLRIFPTAEPSAMVMTMESLRIEPRGEMVALIPSEQVAIETLTGEGIARSFEILHDGEIIGALSETDAALDLDFPSLTARLVESRRRGTPLDEALSITLSAFGASVRALREGSVDLTLGATSVAYDFRMTEAAGGGAVNQSGSGVIEGPRLEFAATEMDAIEDATTLGEAAAAGVTMSISFSTGPSTGSSVQDFGAGPLVLNSTARESGMTLAFTGGRLEGSLYSAGGTFEGGMGPMNGNASFDGMGLDVSAPLVVTPDDQPMRYAFHFDNVLPSPELVEMLGVAPFAGDSVSMALDIGGLARLVREIPMDGSELDDDEPPFDVSQIRLDNVLLRVGDSEFTGSGAVTLIGGLLANIGRDRPEAEGDLVFNLVGGERLLTRLQSLNLIPNDQLFFVRMMMNGLGRPVGEDHLQSDVAFRPGGIITVNGAPLPF